MLEDIQLAIDMLGEADRFACEALSMYAHKISIFDTRTCSNGLSLFEHTFQYQQKLRALRERLEKLIESGEKG